MCTWSSWPKHFLYLSANKVDALYYQLERPKLARIAKKLTIDLKLLQAELSDNTPAETIYSRLRVALRFLEEQEHIGSISHPGRYFAGRGLMRWGPYDSSGKDGLVWFGCVQNDTAIGLGGSLHNVVGAVGPSSAHSHSATYAMLSVLERELTAEAVRGHATDPDDDDDEALAMLAIELASMQMRGPLYEVEFVAKRLLWGSGREVTHVLLGTPLYVAAAD